MSERGQSKWSALNPMTRWVALGLTCAVLFAPASARAEPPTARFPEKAPVTAPGSAPIGQPTPSAPAAPTQPAAPAPAPQAPGTSAAPPAQQAPATPSPEPGANATTTPAPPTGEASAQAAPQPGPAPFQPSQAGTNLEGQPVAPAAAQPSDPPYYFPPPQPGRFDGDDRYRVRYAEDRMVRTSPFVDATAGGMSWSQRLSGFFILGAQGGVFIARRVRVVGRIGVFAAEAEEESPYSVEGLPPGYRGMEPGADPAVIVWGGSVGYALGHSEGFALSPSLTFLRTDVSRHGSFLGLTLPFEWATRRSLRIGFEVTGGVAMGGTIRAVCDGSFSGGFPSSPSNTCEVNGETRDFNRPRGSGFYLGFQLGWGLGPKPESEAVTSAARK